MSELIDRSVELWRTSSNVIHEHFGLDTPPEPKRVRIISTTDALRIGGQYVPGLLELQITQASADNKIPLEGVIHRECLFHALPADLCDESKHDVASEYARYKLSKKDRELWLNEWKNIPPIRIRANLVYNSFELMDWMHNLGSFQELDTLIHELGCMSRYGKTLNFEEYIEYMTRRIQDIVVGLSQTEVKIIDALRKEESASYRQIARITGLSESWVSTRINKLKKRYVLVELTTTPFSRIGIRTFHVLLSGPSWDDPTRYIKDCPFLYDVRPILNGPWQVIARLAVPDNIENIRSLDQMVSILQRNGIAVDVSETYSVGQTNSFYHYNGNSNQWEIPWVALEGWGHRIQEESLDQLVERIDYPAKSTDSYLDKLDLQILELTQQGIASTRALRKNLALGQTKLSNRVKKLRSEGLIRKIWNVYNIGLVERVALRATDRKTAGLLDAWSRELPMAILRFEENRNLLMVTELPMGGSTRLMNALRTLKWPVTVSPIGSGVWGHWVFPKSSWNVERQNWNAAKTKITTWLNQLVMECEKSTETTTDSHGHFLQTK